MCEYVWKCKSRFRYKKTKALDTKGFFLCSCRCHRSPLDWTCCLSLHSHSLAENGQWNREIKLNSQLYLSPIFELKNQRALSNFSFNGRIYNGNGGGGDSTHAQLIRISTLLNRSNNLWSILSVRAHNKHVKPPPPATNAAIESERERKHIQRSLS